MKFCVSFQLNVLKPVNMEISSESGCKPCRE